MTATAILPSVILILSTSIACSAVRPPAVAPGTTTDTFATGSTPSAPPRLSMAEVGGTQLVEDGPPTRQNQGVRKATIQGQGIRSNDFDDDSIGGNPGLGHSTACSATPPLPSPLIDTSEFQPGEGIPPAFTLASLTQPARDGQVQDDAKADRGDGDGLRDNEGLWETTLQGQGFSNQDFDANSVGATLGLGYFLTDVIEVGARQSFNMTSVENRPGKDTLYDGTTRIFGDFHIPFECVSPFVGASFGWVYGGSVEESLAAGLEAGLKYYVKEDAFLYGQIGWDWFFEKASRVDNSFDDGAWIYGIGIGLTF